MNVQTQTFVLRTVSVLIIQAVTRVIVMSVIAALHSVQVSSTFAYIQKLQRDMVDNIK
jgi:hypothetical protein